MLEGEYDFRVGEQTFRAVPGTFVFGPRGIPHTFKCVGTGPGKIQVIITPPGFEAFFEELDVLAEQGGVSPLVLAGEVFVHVAHLGVLASFLWASLAWRSSEQLCRFPLICGVG